MAPPPSHAPAPKVTVLHGPNLDRLGVREPEIYGRTTLADLDAAIVREAEALGLAVVCRQSNHEGQLIEWVHEADRGGGGLVINPAGYTHTSVALADALRTVRIPVVEVHLSNLYARESYRQVSRTAPACAGVIMGLGVEGYLLAIRYLSRHLGVRPP